MRKVVLTFGLLGGAVMSSVQLGSLPFTDEIGDKGVLLGYTAMVMAFLMVYFGVRSYRDQVLGGRISFGRALLVGGLISLVASACYVATWEFIYFQLDYGAEFTAQYTRMTLDRLRESGASEARLAAAAQEMAAFAAKYDRPLYNAAITLLEPLPVGLLFTLASALLLSRVARQPARA